MNCVDVRALLPERQTAPSGSAELEAHLASCPSCQRELQQHQALWSVLDPPRPVEAQAPPSRLLRHVDDELASGGPHRSRLALVAVLLVGVAAVVVGVRTGFRSDLAKLALMPLLVQLAVLAALLLAGVMGAIRVPLVSLWPRRIAYAALLGVAVMGVKLAISSRVTGHLPEGEGTLLVMRAAGCFAFGMLDGAPLVALLLLLSRPGSPSWRGLAAGGAGAALSLSILLMHCAIAGVVHHLLGHLGAALLLIAVGWVAARARTRRDDDRILG